MLIDGEWHDTIFVNELSAVGYLDDRIPEDEGDDDLGDSELDPDECEVVRLLPEPVVDRMIAAAVAEAFDRFKRVEAIRSGHEPVEGGAL